METILITEEDAHSLLTILGLFKDSRRLLIQQGSLTIDNVIMAWDEHNISLTFKKPPPQEDAKEG